MIIPPPNRPLSQSERELLQLLANAHRALDLTGEPDATDPAPQPVKRGAEYHPAPSFASTFLSHR
jgi:hypothetical protein